MGSNRWKGVVAALILLGGFYCYYHSHQGEVVATFNYISSNQQQKYSDERVEFVYPAHWQVNAEKVTGGEVIHHVVYRAENQQAMGYVQVWTAIKPLEDFLKESRNSAADGSGVEKMSISPFKPENASYEGYLLAYERKGLKNNFVAREFFCQQNKHIYRVSLFVTKEHWNESYHQIFDELVNSFHIKNW